MPGARSIIMPTNPAADSIERQYTEDPAQLPRVAAMKLFTKEWTPSGKLRLYFLDKRIFSIRLNRAEMAERLRLKLQIALGSGNGRLLVSIVIPVYQQTDVNMLGERLLHYAALPKEVRRKFELVLVDDGSPHAVTLPDADLNMTLLRILEDIPWNQTGASNLGVCFAKADNLLLTDLDHTVTPEVLDFMFSKELLLRDVWKFGRVNDDQVVKPHPNTFFMRKDFFLMINGYDEDFCGNYGYKDQFFGKYTLPQHNANVQTAKQCMRHITADTAREHTLVRCTAVNEQLFHSKQGLHSRRMLRFPWKFVASCTCA